MKRVEDTDTLVWSFGWMCAGLGMWTENKSWEKVMNLDFQHLRSEQIKVTFQDGWFWTDRSLEIERRSKR